MPTNQKLKENKVEPAKVTGLGSKVLAKHFDKQQPSLNQFLNVSMLSETNQANILKFVRKAEQHNSLIQKAKIILKRNKQ